MNVRAPHGWDWFSGPTEANAEPNVLDPSRIDLAGQFARCFSGADGQAVLDHLQGITLRRVLTPSATDHELRHLEGQRHLVTYVLALIARGLRG